LDNVLQALRERGFIQQCTDDEALSKRLTGGSVVYYCGFDATATSLHCGSLMPIMAMAHLQRAGHTPIAIIGGGTTMVGDPSGKTEMRKMLTPAEIEENGRGILSQLQRYLDLDGQRGLFLNNADWLLQLNYIEFLREIGRHFRVNEMLRSEAYRLRLEREDGLSFIEFNYQILQAYDFLTLARERDCTLQIGGDDQWGNIVAGIELIRRVNGNEAYGLTFPLITTSDGKKMGKTEKGALFLDPAVTTPYDFFQYWRNVTDADTGKFMLMFTFLPVSEIETVMAGNINQAKERLAYEVTALIHGKEEAEKALAGARAAFGGGGDKASMPTVSIPRARFDAGIGVIDLFFEAGLAGTKSDARRLVDQGGAVVADSAVTDVKAVIGASVLDADGETVLRAGKKKFVRVVTA